MASAQYIEELVQKKKANGDDRRDSRIRGSIESTISYFSHPQRSIANTPFNSRPSSIPESPQLVGTDTIGNAISQTNGQDNPFQDRQSSTHYRDNPFSNSSSRTASVENLHDLEKAPYPSSVSSYPTEKTESVVDISPAHLHDDHHLGHGGPLTFRQRVKHFTFANYAMTMSTGGVALIISGMPFKFDGMVGLGQSLFIWNLFLFTGVTSIMIWRFCMYPSTFKNAFANVHEGFFIATFLLSIATIITNTVAYGLPATNNAVWLSDALRAVFWIYTVVVTFFAIGYYHVLFMTKQLVITNVLPGWVLPIFPAMLVGTLASAIAGFQEPGYAYPMIIVGLGYQGLGFFLALAMYGLYFGRLLTSGLPLDQSRPAMFIAVGPPAFTGLALLGMAKDIQTVNLFKAYPLMNIANQDLLPDILSLFALVMAIFLWVLAFWFWGIAVLAAFEGVLRNDFHLNWYAYVFPNVGFTIVTVKIGERLDSILVKSIGEVMGIILFFLLFLIYYCHIKAVVTHKIMWPGRDEDSH